MISPSDYLIGVLLIAWVWGGCVVVGALIVRALADGLTASTRAAAIGIVSAAALIAVHVVPGMLTLLTPASVAITTGLAILAAALLVRRRQGLRSDPEPPRHAPASGPLSSALAVLALLALTGRALANVWTSRLLPPSEVDINGIHLPTVASWIQTQSIWGNHEFSPFFAAGNYTQNVDITYLATLLPLHQDVFARASVMPWYGLLGLVVYAFARELRTPRATAALIAGALLSTRIVASTAIVYGLPDAQTLAGLAAGGLFFARHFRTNARADLTLAGVGLGIAFGGKWYGVATVAALVLAWVVVRAIQKRPLARIAADTARISGWIGLLGGVWLVRNWVRTDDPLFPLSVHPLGISIFTAPPDPVRQLFGGRVVDYINHPHVMRHVFVPAWHRAFGTPGALIAVLGVVALVLWIVQARRRESPPPAVVMALFAAGLCAVIYVFTPYSALGLKGAPLGDVVFGNSRYVTPGLVLLTGPAAWAVSRFPALARLGVNLLAAVFIVTATRKTMFDPLSFPQSSHAPEYALGLGACGVAALVARSVIPSSLRRPAALLTVAGLTALVFVAGRRAERTESVNRYANEPAIASLQNLPGKPHLGLAGYWSTTGIQMTYPVFGPRLDTRVSYIGRYVDGGLRPATQAGFISALRSGRYDRIAIGSYQLPVSPRQPLLAWARSAGWTVAIKDARTTIMVPPSQ